MNRDNAAKQHLTDKAIEHYFKTFLQKDCDAFSWEVMAVIKLEWSLLQPGYDAIPRNLKPLSNDTQIYFDVEYLAFNTNTSIADLILQKESFLFSEQDIATIAETAPLVMPDDYSNEHSYTEQELNLKLHGHLPESLVFLITRYIQTNPKPVKKLLRNIRNPHLYISSIINRNIRNEVRRIWQS